MSWLVLLLLSSFAQADSLTVYAMPSPAGIKWSSPSRLATSAMWNRLRPDLNLIRHELGHAAIRFQCGPLATEVLTGMTGASVAESHELLVKKKIGLGILFHRFEGYLQDPVALERDIEARMKKGSISWIRFEISRATCQRIDQFMREFRAMGPKIPYGLSARPRRREGASSSSFAAAAMEVAGLLSSDWRAHWTRSIRVPAELIGLEGNVVPLRAILLTRAWAEPQVPHRPIEFIDPNLMYGSITQAALDPASQFTKMKNGDAVGIAVDVRHVPAPTEPIWH